MVTEAPIGPEVKVLATYPLFNDHIFISETGTDDTADIIRADRLNIPTGSVDMVKTAGLNIPFGSRLYILENPTDKPFFNVTAGYFYGFDFNDNTATFTLVKHPGPEDKKIKEDIMSNPNDYELFAKLSGKATIGSSYIKFNKRGESFFFLRNKRYIISQGFKSTTDNKYKFFITWKER